MNAGIKHDSGKPRPDLVLGSMARAMLAVAEVAAYGAAKYTADGWQTVPDGLARYTAAKDRHRLMGALETTDYESGLRHAAHEAWNALAVLELLLRREEERDLDDMCRAGRLPESIGTCGNVGEGEGC